MKFPNFKLRKFRDLSIHRKLILLVSICSGVSVFVIGGALFSYHMFNLRSQFRENVVVLADVVASFAEAPVAFGDRAGVREVLSTLRINTDITSAEIRLGNGSVFAQFEQTALQWAEIPDYEIETFDGWKLFVSRPIKVLGQADAWLLITADFSRVFSSSILSMSFALMMVLIIGVLVSVVMVGAFRGVIIGPIKNLVTITYEVATKRDYSLRATVEGNDEIGVLTTNFNDMLSRIEDSDIVLREAYSQLQAEIKVSERLQNDLGKTSRVAAGMAEVATGVLHNVGNVLNTVNLSVQSVQDRLESTRLGHLGQVVDLLKAHDSDLGMFLTDDARGKAIPGFLSKVTNYLKTENDDLRAEMSGLIENVEHIKEIVSTQQTFAKVLGVTEQLDPEKLVEEALSLIEGITGRHNIFIIRHYDCASEILGDRHKIIQILVNLFTNAKDAMLDIEAHRRKLTIRIFQTGDDQVAISVTDTGVGIKQENLSSIFHHGFTTKANGHGFGLHLSALSAQEMGGSLKVLSAGLDRGSVFTLSIPLALEPVRK
jgi:two-component system, NtrC family, sensor kinase